MFHIAFERRNCCCNFLIQPRKPPRATVASPHNTSHLLRNSASKLLSEYFVMSFGQINAKNVISSHDHSLTFLLFLDTQSMRPRFRPEMGQVGRLPGPQCGGHGPGGEFCIEYGLT